MKVVVVVVLGGRPRGYSAVGRFSCRYLICWSFSTAWLLPRRIHLVVSRPSTPTGPRACRRLVLMPTWQGGGEEGKEGGGKAGLHRSH